jgi:protoporphyrinogen oxidase/glycosyltransferase involved in cell wall biosynthesis
MKTLVVFSHLRWDFVFQRPQHLMTRLAPRYKVYFIEEPVHDPGAARLDVNEIAPNLHVCRPHTSIQEPGFAAAQMPVLRRLVEDLLVARSIHSPIAWFYTPLALPLLQALDAETVVYDCMDELSAFKDAPRELLELELALLRVADVVFTGGPSLYRSKQASHTNVHCFPSSVEREHFARATDPRLDHPAQCAIPHPRFGFFGVIDERFDPACIAMLADTHPDWQVVLVGPVVKIDPATLPARPNIHYLGQRGYQELPGFLAGWDVAMLPFAINEATRYISPTKVLEYMAAEKPVVSTPVTDVVAPYGHIVHIAAGPASFTAACERALGEDAAARSQRAARMRAIVNGTSWDATAGQMHKLIEGAAELRTAAGTSTALAPVRKHTIVIGAGPTGLSAAYHLGEQSLLLEQHDRVGGWCRSVMDRGFTFDHAGHIMFSNDPYVHELYGQLLGANVHWQDREAWIYSKKVYTRYPFQGALYGLPPEVLKECLIGAIEARFGSLRGERHDHANEHAPGHANGSALGLANRDANVRRRGSSPGDCKADSITDCCADGIAGIQTPLIELRAPPPASAAPRYRNFEEFIHGVWGAGVARHFAIPYNRKLWAVPLAEMETSWLGGRVPMPDLEEMIDGALRPVARPQGPNARFGYPLRGGFQALMDGFLPHLRGELRLKARVSRVVPSRHLVVLDDGSRYVYDKLISTMPLPVLVRMIGDEAPARVRLAASKLRHVSVRCVNLGVGRENLTDKHWIYYPEDSVFHRIFVQGAVSAHNNAPGGFGLTCEITYSPHKPLPCEGEELIDRCIADCIAVGIINADDPIIARNQVDMPYAYVVYDHARAESVATVREWLASQDIELAGRYSEWEYYNSDHAFLAGRKAAERLEAARDPRGHAPVPARTAPPLAASAGLQPAAAAS